MNFFKFFLAAQATIRIYYLLDREAEFFKKNALLDSITSPHLYIWLTLSLFSPTFFLSLATYLRIWFFVSLSLTQLTYTFVFSLSLSLSPHLHICIFVLLALTYMFFFLSLPTYLTESNLCLIGPFRKSKSISSAYTHTHTHTHIQAELFDIYYIYTYIYIYIH
jgi:hypothetical protein